MSSELEIPTSESLSLSPFPPLVELQYSWDYRYVFAFAAFVLASLFFFTTFLPIFFLLLLTHTLVAVRSLALFFHFVLDVAFLFALHTHRYTQLYHICITKKRDDF